MNSKNVNYSSKEKLAFSAIKYYLNTQKKLEVKAIDVFDNLQKQGACFVTVYVKDELRGCIGTSKAFEPLYKNIIRNSIAAISSDFRFEQISENDLANLAVEISVLSPLADYEPKNTHDLLEFLKKEKPGLILKRGVNKALFLPQVWEKLPRPEDFLAQLSLKAGLTSDSWKDKDTQFTTFTVTN